MVAPPLGAVTCTPSAPIESGSPAPLCLLVDAVCVRLFAFRWEFSTGLTHSVLEDDDVVGGVCLFPVGEVGWSAVGGLFEEAYVCGLLFGCVFWAWFVAPGVSFLVGGVGADGSAHGRIIGLVVQVCELVCDPFGYLDADGVSVLTVALGVAEMVVPVVGEAL